MSVNAIISIFEEFSSIQELEIVALFSLTMKSFWNHAHTEKQREKKVHVTFDFEFSGLNFNEIDEWEFEFSSFSLTSQESLIF